MYIVLSCLLPGVVSLIIVCGLIVGLTKVLSFREQNVFKRNTCGVCGDLLTKEEVRKHPPICGLGGCRIDPHSGKRRKWAEDYWGKTNGAKKVRKAWTLDCLICGLALSPERAADNYQTCKGCSWVSPVTGTPGFSLYQGNLAPGRSIVIWNGVMLDVCEYCSLPLCQGECQKMSNNDRLYNRCQDCGSQLHPTGAAGCAFIGYKSGIPNTPPVPPVKPKTPVKSSGIPGYSEEGMPEDWDMAMGTVRGYRWWKLSIPESWMGVRDYTAATPHYDINGKLVIPDFRYRTLGSGDPHPKLLGAYSGTYEWGDGVIEAGCAKRSGHEPPEWRVECGCGYWAYWKPSLKASGLIRWQTSAPKYGHQLPDGESWRSIPVFGCIEGSGRVILGNKGFRSQYAKITALAIGDEVIPEFLAWTVKSTYGAAPSSVMSNDDFIRYLAKGTVSNSDTIPASEDEVKSRLARVEGYLQEMYPSAHIISSESNLKLLYPPDPNYGKKD